MQYRTGSSFGKESSQIVSSLFVAVSVSQKSTATGKRNYLLHLQGAAV
jgi:hypothetical protein